MKVLITGAGGSLGRFLAPALAEKGHEPIMFDVREIESPYKLIQGDVTNLEDIENAVKGVDAVVHAAAVHGLHLSKYTPDFFWKLNVTGTHNVYEAVRKSGIKKVLLCSTMGVYGDSLNSEDKSIPVADETIPTLPPNIYGFSKKTCENVAEYFHRVYGISTIAYRLGMFGSKDFVQYGFRLLKGGVDNRDVAQAFILGLENNTIGFDYFNIFAQLPFPAEELQLLKDDPESLLVKYYPDIKAVVEQNGIDIKNRLETWRTIYWSIEKAKLMLGYNPKHNFPEFYKALKESNKSYYPHENKPQWGI